MICTDLKLVLYLIRILPNNLDPDPQHCFYPQFPYFQQQRESKSSLTPIEDETEKMRAELLRKEKQLLELKKKEIDLQLAGIKAGIKQHQVPGTPAFFIKEISAVEPEP